MSGVWGSLPPLSVAVPLVILHEVRLTVQLFAERTDAQDFDWSERVASWVDDMAIFGWMVHLAALVAVAWFGGVAGALGLYVLGAGLGWLVEHFAGRIDRNVKVGLCAVVALWPLTYWISKAITAAYLG